MIVSPALKSSTPQYVNRRESGASLSNVITGTPCATASSIAGVAVRASEHDSSTASIPSFTACAMRRACTVPSSCGGVSHSISIGPPERRRQLARPGSRRRCARRRTTGCSRSSRSSRCAAGARPPRRRGAGAAAASRRRYMLRSRQPTTAIAKKPPRRRTRTLFIRNRGPRVFRVSTNGAATGRKSPTCAVLPSREHPYPQLPWTETSHSKWFASPRRRRWPRRASWASATRRRRPRRHRGHAPHLRLPAHPRHGRHRRGRARRGAHALHRRGGGRRRRRRARGRHRRRPAGGHQPVRQRRRATRWPSSRWPSTASS